MSLKLNPKYTTIIGAVLAIIGLLLGRIWGITDVIIMFFTFFLGIFLFVIGIAGLIGNWLKGRKNQNTPDSS